MVKEASVIEGLEGAMPGETAVPCPRCLELFAGQDVPLGIYRPNELEAHVLRAHAAESWDW